METIKEIIIIFSEKDSNKRVTYFKVFVELSIILQYSIVSYLCLFGRYDLLDPTKFSDLYNYFITGNLHVCVLLFVFWFMMVRYLPYYILYGLDYLVIAIFAGGLKKLKKIKINVRPIQILLLFDVVEKTNNRQYKTGNRFNLFEGILKYLYYESKGVLLKHLFHNISLIVQFSLIVLIFFAEQIHLPNVFNIIVWVILGYLFINQIFIFFLIEVLDDEGYKVIETMEGFKRYDNNYNSISSSFNPDKPIFSESQNLLFKRDYFSGVLSNSIRNYTDKESLVIGIDGKWGDGKTSFVNMSLERFIYNTNDKKYVLFFNPWNFTSPNELTIHFLNELKRYLRKILGNKYSNDLDDKFFLYINYITNGGFQAPQDISAQDNDTESLKKEIDKVLRSLDFKLIVVVDDLDRLTELETKQVFRFVKLVGDFPNIIYIIPFDKQKTIESCRIEEDYLKKIIQIEIKLPPMISSEINTILNERLKQLFESLNIETFVFEKWSRSLNGPIRNYIRNLRDVNRLINALKFYLSSNHVKDLNVNDFVYITTIQIFDSKLYSYIASNRTFFTSTTSDYKEKFKEDLDKKKESFNIGANEFYNLLSDLFPQVEQLKHNVTEHMAEKRWRREHLICSGEYFEKYFLYPSENDRLSKTEIEQIIINSNDLEAFKNNLLRLIKDGNYDFFINRFLDYQYNSNINIIVKNVIKGFLSVGKDIPDETRKTFVFFTPKSTTMYVIHKYFEDDPILLGEEFIKEIYLDENNDIDSLMDLYFRIFKQWGFDRDKSLNKKNFESDDKFSRLRMLNMILLERIRKSFGEICSLPNMDDLIFYWKKLDLENNKIDELLKNYLNKSNENFIRFFDILKKSMWVQSSSHGYQTREIYNLESIEDVIDIDYLKDKSMEIEAKIKREQQTNANAEGFANEQLFLYNKMIFDGCLSGKIDYKDTEWYRKRK